jgi:hypothetical protein
MQARVDQYAELLAGLPEGVATPYPYQLKLAEASWREKNAPWRLDAV